MWHIPPGQGKSRVVATIALILLETKTNVKTVHILHCNKLLRRKEETDFDDFYKTMTKGEKVIHHD